MTPDPPVLKDGRLREALRRHLSERSPRRLPLASTKAAAVLLPLFERGGEIHVWLVRRPTSMRSHAGQVAFPGGKSDAADDSLRATALRETHEELGIDPARVDVLGALDDVHTYVSGFTISPWVGWLAPETAVVPSANEVARAFAAPLRTFFEPPGGAPPFVGWTIEGELVWGATAAILRGFVAILGELAGTAAGAQ
jgi:8-oxo-dGTP pyrophosphatase MutT (NUDIX family)